MADILTTERQTFKFRLLVVLAIGLAFFFAGSGGDANWVVALSLLYLCYAIALQAVLASRPQPVFVYPMIVVDALFLSLVVHWSGDAATLLLVLFPLMVPFYAAYGGYAPAFCSATAMLLAFGITQGASGRPVFNAALLTQIPLFYLLAALSGYLAQGRIRRLEEQEALQRLARLEDGARSLSGAVRTIQEASDLSIMLQEMAEASPHLTGLPDCLIGILDRKSGALVTRATTTERSRLGVERLDYLVEWPRDGSLTDQVLAVHEPIAVRRADEDDTALPVWAKQLQLQAMLGVPLVSRGVDVGIIYFYGVSAGHAFSDREVALAETFANVVALVAVNAQLYEDVQVTIGSVISELRPVVMPKAAQRSRRLSVIDVGDLIVDIPNRQAKIGGKPVSLTPTEFDLLAVLAENSGNAVDQETLLRRVWGEDYGGRSTVVDVGVHRLRRKIEEGQGAPRRIITVRGSGYMLVPVTTPARRGEER